MNSSPAVRSTNYVNRQNLLAREPTGLRFKSVVLEGNDMEICATVIARRFFIILVRAAF